MPHLQELCDRLEAIAPVRLAEDWDNVGLLVGDPQRMAHRVMTCLTVTPKSAAEAIEQDANLVITHHPFPFRSLKRMTTDSTVGRLLWQLIGHGVAIYSPHTAWDSARTGINQQLSEGIGLVNIRPLQPIPDDPDQLGSGRCGEWAEPHSLADAAERVKQFLSLELVQCVGALDGPIDRVAVACGSAGLFLEPACRAGCQLLVTGETSFHSCLEAEALGMGIVLPGHYASERFSLEVLALQLQQEYPDLHVWASQRESDPIHWI